MVVQTFVGQIAFVSLDQALPHAHKGSVQEQVEDGLTSH